MGKNPKQRLGRNRKLQKVPKEKTFPLMELKNIQKIDHLEGEFKNINPTSFDGESKSREEAEAWLLDIKK